MENTLANKAKFFAQYWGQRVALKNESISSRLYQMDRVVILHCETHTLEIKPLSSISYEDALHVARLAHQLTERVKFDIKRSDNGRLIHLTWVDHIKRQVHISINEYGCINTNWHFLEKDDGTTKSFKINIGEIQTSSRRPIPYIAIVDYLRSQGYALPWMDLSVEELVNRGWVKLKGE